MQIKTITAHNNHKLHNFERKYEFQWRHFSKSFRGSQ